MQDRQVSRSHQVKLDHPHGFDRPHVRLCHQAFGLVAAAEGNPAPQCLASHHHTTGVDRLVLEGMGEERGGTVEKTAAIIRG